MPYRKNNIVVGHYYHVFNRGNGKRTIFFSDENYRYCLRLIQKNALRYHISVIVYCLMSNHYHLLLRQDSDVPISKFMQSKFNSYVQAVNKQLGQKGPLFEGRFKHVLVDRNECIRHLMRYIHLNPLKAGMVSYVADWPYSNYLEFVNKKKENLTDLQARGLFFDSPAQYEMFVKDECQQPPNRFEKYTLE
jgi:putative transposase